MEKIEVKFGFKLILNGFEYCNLDIGLKKEDRIEKAITLCKFIKQFFVLLEIELVAYSFNSTMIVYYLLIIIFIPCYVYILYTLPVKFTHLIFNIPWITFPIITFKESTIEITYSVNYTRDILLDIQVSRC